MANADADALCAICRPIPVALPPRTEADGSQKPQTLSADLGSLPAALEPLTALPYWLLWRWKRTKKGKWTKVPYQPSGRLAKSDDPETWSTYDQVIAVVDQFDGIGFVLHDHAAFDLDKCRDRLTCTVAPWALELIAKSKSYAEVTPSGTGLRVIGTAAGASLDTNWPMGEGAKLEAYRRANRYITISGCQLPGTPTQLNNIDAVFDATVADMDARDARTRRGGNGAGAGNGDAAATESAAADNSAALTPNMITLLSFPNLGAARQHGGYGDRSALAYKFFIDAVRGRVSKEDITSECFKEAYRGCAIYEHCQDQSDPREYVARQIQHAKEDLLDKEIIDINKTYALVLAGNKAAVMKLEGKRNGKSTFRLLQVDAFKQWFANQRITVGEKPVPLANYWLGHKQRRQYEGIEFAPGGAPPGYYNLWRGFSVEPRAGDCSLFLKHLEENCAQGDTFLYNWIVGWFAQIAQQPTVKPGTALCLRGKQGVGKTKVGQVFGSLFEDHYELVADPRYIVGQFNAHMAQLLLLHADEAFWAGDKRAEGKLKDLVTGFKHRLEFKGVDPIVVQNLIRLFVTGNQDWLVPAGFGERRFAVIDVGEARKEDHPYFAAIDKEMDEGGREALLHHLLNFDLSTVDLRTIPKTEALLEQIIETATPEQAWWLDTLKRGKLPRGMTEANMCPKRILFLRYIRHANLQGVRRRAIETKIGMFLNKYVGPELKGDEKKSYTVYNRHGQGFTEFGWVYTFPPLANCRARFAQEMQQDITWEEADDAEAQWVHETREEAVEDDLPF
jgi:hypothetical protein